MTYLLDADALIEASKKHYGFDFCPAYWEWLIARNKAGQVFSIEKVAQEISVFGDELSAWVGSRGPDFFLKPDEKFSDSSAAVSAWAASQRYTPGALSAFFSKADYYLVSQAAAGGYVVVTHERSELNKPGRVKIPDVCAGIGVRCVSPFDMLRAENARFVLES